MILSLHQGKSKLEKSKLRKQEFKRERSEFDCLENGNIFDQI